MKTSTKNAIKLVVAALFGFGLISSFFSIFSPDPDQNLAASLIVVIFYFLIVSALLYSVYKSNKKQSQLEKEQQND